MASPEKKAERVSHLRWVPIKDMRVSPKAQREFRQSHADMFAADFDLESLGYPVVNLRDGVFYIVDGQHRVAAAKMIGWADQQLQCECYEGLSEAEEADLFLRRDNRKAISSFDKFRIGITAERDTECDIDRIVRAAGLTISNNKRPGAIGAPGTLRKVYSRSGPGTLSRALRLIRDSYGDAGFDAAVINGMGMLCQRYNGTLNDEDAIAKLGRAHGGVTGLLGKAETIRRQTGGTKSQCVAAAAVELINVGRGGKKLPSWWRSDDAS